MEMYIYKCLVCGFSHQVPAYWVEFNPQETFEFEHPDLKAGKICDSLSLKFHSKNL